MTNLRTFKAGGVALGTGLAILWIAGLSSLYAPGWFTWLIGVAAVCSFLIAGRASETDVRFQRNAPIALSVGLFALWIAGLGTQAVGWMSWWTFAFACASLVFGVTAAGAPAIDQHEMKSEEGPYEEHLGEPGKMPPEPPEEEKERFKKAG